MDGKKNQGTEKTKVTRVLKNAAPRLNHSWAHVRALRRTARVARHSLSLYDMATRNDSMTTEDHRMMRRSLALALISCAVLSISLLAQVDPALVDGMKWRQIGPFRGGRVGIKAHMIALCRPCGANRPAIDMRRGDADKKTAVEAPVSGTHRAITSVRVEVHGRRLAPIGGKYSPFSDLNIAAI